MTGTTIKNCFGKCGVVKSNDDLMEVEKDDLEFEVLVRELSSNMSAVEYVYFDVDILATSEPMINEHEVDWREKFRVHCIKAITTQSNVNEETQIMISDNVLLSVLQFLTK